MQVFDFCEKQTPARLPNFTLRRWRTPEFNWSDGSQPELNGSNRMGGRLPGGRKKTTTIFF